MIVQEKLVAEDGWIMDGDLGPYDVVEVRLRAADTVIFLDFSFLCCARRAIRRSRERINFWWWILAYRWKSRPALLKAIAGYAPNAKLQVFRDPEALNRFVADAAREITVLITTYLMNRRSIVFLLTGLVITAQADLHR